MASLPEFTSTGEYLLAILSVTLTTLGLLAIGGIAKAFFSSHRQAPSFRRKLWFFPLFIIGIFAIGWLSAAAQQAVLAYLKQNAATSISGILIAILVAWFLYDWVVWRSRR